MEILPYYDAATRPIPFVWYLLETKGELPKCRVGHSCCVVKTPSGTKGWKDEKEEEKEGGSGDTVTTTLHHNGHLYLIGGANPDNTFSDNPVLDLNLMCWDYRHMTGFVPRYEQSLFVMRRNGFGSGTGDPDVIYIFGGANQTDTLNDIQYLDSGTNEWVTVSPMGSGELPAPRTHHCATSICTNSDKNDGDSDGNNGDDNENNDDRFIVFGGGAQGSSPVMDSKVHSFSVSSSTWSTLDVKGEAPKPRLGHVCVGLGNRVYVHGGLCEGQFYDDFHMLDLGRHGEGAEWHQLEVTGQHPSARAAHGAAAYSDSIFIFGGMSIDGALNDFYQLDTVSLTSTRMAVDVPAPRPRLDFAMTITELTLDWPPQSPQGGPDTEEGQDTPPEDRQHSDGAAVCEAAGSQIHSPRRHTTLPVCIIHGGMDTEGGIFDDVIVIFLS
ncbi:rab9 effector protein with kelch motifs-like [Argonauta hians]